MNEKPNNGLDRRYLLFALRIAGDFGATIAVPVVLFALLGQYADTRWNTAPRLTILAFVLAALLSGLIIYRKSKAYGKEFSSLDKDDTASSE